MTQRNIRKLQHRVPKETDLVPISSQGQDFQTTIEEIIDLVPVASSPTLNEVLTVGNTSTLGATVGSITIGETFLSFKFTWEAGNVLKIYNEDEDKSFYFDVANGRIQWQNVSGDLGTWVTSTLTANRNWTFPDASGTVSLEPELVVSAAATLTLAEKGDYIFTGTSTTWTLPPVTGTEKTFYRIKNRGSGTITLNTTAAANEIYSTSAINTFAIVAGAAYFIFSDGTYYNVE